MHGRIVELLFLKNHPYIEDQQSCMAKTVCNVVVNSNLLSSQECLDFLCLKILTILTIV